MLNSDPNLSEQHSVSKCNLFTLKKKEKENQSGVYSVLYCIQVEEMAKELDTLLDSIQGPGGFSDASVSAHKQSVTALEEGILVLSERCRKWTVSSFLPSQSPHLILLCSLKYLPCRPYL